jgi:hypothetical protein
MAQVTNPQVTETTTNDNKTEETNKDPECSVDEELQCCVCDQLMGDEEYSCSRCCRELHSGCAFGSGTCAGCTDTDNFQDDDDNSNAKQHKPDKTSKSVKTHMSTRDLKHCRQEARTTKQNKQRLRKQDEARGPHCPICPVCDAEVQTASGAPPGPVAQCNNCKCAVHFFCVAETYGLCFGCASECY